jgi:hypothetical protein
MTGYIDIIFSLYTLHIITPLGRLPRRPIFYKITKHSRGEVEYECADDGMTIDLEVSPSIITPPVKFI